MSLNPEQEKVVAFRGPRLLTLAGAGTGKTSAITHRVAGLIEEGVAPWKILAVTFTNKAAAEMRERISALCADRGLGSEGLWCGTFHSICARILRRQGEAVGLSKNFTIYDADDQKTLVNRILKALGYAKTVSAGQVLGSIDQAKNRGLPPSQMDELGLQEPINTIVYKTYCEYQYKLQQSDAADFGDLLRLAVELLRKEQSEEDNRPDSDAQTARPESGTLTWRFSHIVVDEYQDTNLIQAEFVDRLARHASMCVVGDDDQSIYGWRGADVTQILGFPERHPGCEVVRLEQNYRSTTHILACAQRIIEKSFIRHPKELWSDLGEGVPVRILYLGDQRDESNLIADEIGAAIDDGSDPNEMVVFFRTNAQSRPIEEAFRRNRIGYRVVGGMRFFDRMEVKDIVAYLRLIDTPRSDLDVERVINRPARGIGATSLNRLRAYATTKGVTLYEALEKPELTDLGKAAQKKVEAFRKLLDDMRAECEGLTLSEIAQIVLERSGYMAALEESNEVEDETRRENLNEFVNGLAEFSRANPDAVLGEYLDQVALASAVEETGEKDLVTLMTVHAGKGLEFERVYITGMEEGVFPHSRSLDDQTEMDEERRLAYVAVTRAKRILTMSVVRERWMYAKPQVNPPSRFVRNLPQGSIMEVGRSPRRDAPKRLTMADVFGDGSETSAKLPTSSVDEQSEPSWDGDIELDAGGGDAGEGIEIYRGMTMRHKKFGMGDVVSWSGSGADLKLTINFSQVGSRTILARFCQPV